MGRGRAWTRHHRKRSIQKRLNIIRNSWGRDHWTHVGVLSKFNLVCSCPMCRDRKYRDSRKSEKQSLEREIDTTEQ